MAQKAKQLEAESAQKQHAAQSNSNASTVVYVVQDIQKLKSPPVYSAGGLLPTVRGRISQRPTHARAGAASWFMRMDEVLDRRKRGRAANRSAEFGGPRPRIILACRHWGVNGPNPPLSAFIRLLSEKIRGKILGYNRSNDSGLGNAAGGCGRLLAGRTGGVGVESGMETSAVLPARRGASLRHDGGPIGISRPVGAGEPVRALSGCAGDSAGPNRGLSRNCSGDFCGTDPSSGCLPADGSPVPHLL